MNPVAGGHWNQPDFLLQNIPPAAARRDLVPETQRHRQRIQHTRLARTIVAHQQSEMRMKFKRLLRPFKLLEILDMEAVNSHTVLQFYPMPGGLARRFFR